MSARGVGLRALACYLPRGRVEVAEIRRHWPAAGAAAGTARLAVPSFDEDVVTMAVEAGLTALDQAGLSTSDVDGVLLGTTSAPYAEHTAAAEVARALGLRREAEVAQLAGSTQSGLAAVRMAADAVAAGRARTVLAIGADARRSEPGGRLEESLGAAAAAAVVTADEPALILEPWASHRRGVPTQWRPDGAANTRAIEDPRFEREKNYLPAVAGAIGALVERAQLDPQSLAFAALSQPDGRLPRAAARAAKLSPDVALAESLAEEAGDLGCAGPLVALRALWAGASVGACGVCVAYGSGTGADAALVQVRRSAPSVPAAPEQLVSYVEYLQRLGHLRGPSMVAAFTPYAATPAAYRDDDFATALRGLECLRCGSVNFPPRPTCVDCGGWDFAVVELPRQGTVVTHNQQFVVAVAPEPVPVAVGVARLDGLRGERGGQVSAMFTDTPLEVVQIGARVELVYRRLGQEDGLVKYGWKFRGLRGS